MFEAARDNGLFESPGFFEQLDALGIDTRFGDTCRQQLPGWIIQSGVLQMATHFLPWVGCLVVKCGKEGLFVATRIENGLQTAEWDELDRLRRQGVAIAKGSDGSRTIFRHYDALPLPVVPNATVTGAGDSLVGALSTMLANAHTMDTPESMDKIAMAAQRAAIATLSSAESVSTGLSPALLSL